jgi:hypothetical protein
MAATLRLHSGFADDAESSRDKPYHRRCQKVLLENMERIRY